jgi:hypothetical protein
MGYHHEMICLLKTFHSQKKLFIIVVKKMLIASILYRNEIFDIKYQICDRSTRYV